MESLLRFSRTSVRLLLCAGLAAVLPSTTTAQLVPRVFTGLNGYSVADANNWLPVGELTSNDSLVVPGGKHVKFDVSFGEVGAINLQTNSHGEVNQTVSFSVSGMFVVDKGALFEVKKPATIALNNVALLGTWKVDNEYAMITVNGTFVLDPGATFDPGYSTIKFANHGTETMVPSLLYYNLHIDSNSTVSTWGNLSVENTVTVESDVVLRDVDTLTILKDVAGAITGGGRISGGTIVQVIDRGKARDGGTFRFHNPLTTMTFFDQGNPPDAITITDVPGVYPENLDPSRVFRHYFDIHATGGSGYRLSLSIQYDPSEDNSSTLDDFAIYRSPDYGTTWFELPATSFDTVAHTITVDSITGFSRYGFGRRSGLSDVGDEQPGATPSGYGLQQNYPNPFNPTTAIQFALPEAGHVSVVVYDIFGREVSRLVDGRLPAGRHESSWNGRNAEGAEVGTGVYFYKITAGSFTQVMKMALVK